jgi:UDP:flavonoid glycosyltransferase YjiC (YdhE family)
MGAEPRRTRVLFIAEAVTLAHVARASELARSLDPSRYEVHAAWDPRYDRLLGMLPYPVHRISSLSTAVFLKRLARGQPMHDTQTLRSYVEEDLATIARVKPDVVVGDFRLSLAASARVAKVPHVAVANAYWSPYARQSFQFPEYEYPLQGVIGRKGALAFFNIFRPLGFAAHVRPLNAVLKEHGLPVLEGDIRTMYTWGDYTAYTDIPELVPTFDLPATHKYIGAVLWSPAVESPPWWDDLPSDRPIVYATLGSSGDSDILPSVLEALSELPVTVIAATADRVPLAKTPSNAYVAQFLRGSEAAARAALVICNGGSPTTYQALAAGVPVLALASNNMDQHLNMEAVCRAGAGMVLRARGVQPGDVREAATEVLNGATYKVAAGALREALRKRDSKIGLSELIERAASSQVRQKGEGL